MSDYTTWENEMMSDRWELHASDGTLLAVVDRNDGELSYHVTNKHGLRVFAGILKLQDAQKIAQRLK